MSSKKGALLVDPEILFAPDFIPDLNIDRFGIAPRLAATKTASPPLESCSGQKMELSRV